MTKLIAPPRVPPSSQPPLGPRTDLEPIGGDRQISEELELWVSGDGGRTLGNLADLFGEKSFAMLFIALLGVPALPLPTGGATHVFEAIAMLLALQLIVGRRQVWLPRRWRELHLAGPRTDRYLLRLSRLVRWLERHSRPRLNLLFNRRASGPCFGALALAGALAAFLAPPFTGLDTLPALGVVVLSVGVLMEDIAVVVCGVAIGAAGIFVELAVGRALLQALRDFL